MQIVKQTINILKLENKSPLPKWVFLAIGLPFFVSGILLINSGKTFSFTCTRVEPSQGNCEVILATLFSHERIPLDFAQIEEARLENGRVHLSTTNNDIQFTLADNSPLTKLEIVDQINTFIDNPEPASLNIEQSDRTQKNIFGVIFILPGLGLIAIAILSTSQISCLFDKQANAIILEEGNLFKSSKSIFALGQVKEVQLIDTLDKKGNGTGYTIDIVMKSGAKIPLEIVRNHVQTAQTINEFLGTI